jgi:hypothetical protein
MAKKVLVLYYTQTGQLEEIVNSFLAGLQQTDVLVERIRVQPVNDYAFPWTSERFFDTMPDSVLAKPAPLQPFTLQHSRYDLVVFAYQPWYLSLSIPANSVLALPNIKEVLRNTPVVTLIGARNMWISSQEKLKKILEPLGSRVVGNIALVDKTNNLVSVITILHWMIGGKKTKYLGVFPKPGVQDEDIKNAEVYGRTVYDYLQAGDYTGMQHKLFSQGAVDVKANLLFIEERAPRLFSIWANFIVKRANRKAWLVVFKYYLLFALFIVAPVVLTVNMVLFRPFFMGLVSRKKAYYAGLREKI